MRETGLNGVEARSGWLLLCCSCIMLDQEADPISLRGGEIDGHHSETSVYEPRRELSITEQGERIG